MGYIIIMVATSVHHGGKKMRYVIRSRFRLSIFRFKYGCSLFYEHTLISHSKVSTPLSF